MNAPQSLEVCSMAAAEPNHTPQAGTLARLTALIAGRSLLTGGQFTLASGRQSALFFDMKPSMLDPEGANLIAREVLARIPLGTADAVGGLALGAVPIVAVVSALSAETPQPLQGFFVRKEAKDHGTARRVEGNLQPGSRAVILEDVTTTGGSALLAAAAVREAGAEVVKVITIVDRLEGAAAAFADAGITFEAILTRQNFQAAG